MRMISRTRLSEMRVRIRIYNISNKGKQCGQFVI
jgi:hypothetical protein